VVIFGLTGGIGSGKSTVAKRLRGRGVPVVDADQLARAVIEPGSAALAAILEAFGRDTQLADGSLDRAKIGARVFAHESDRRRLNAIVHPAVRQAAHEEFERLAKLGEPLCGYEVPLLFEVGLEHELSPILVVDAPLAQRLPRIMRRDGLSEQDARARVAAQMPLAEKARRADYVIENAGTEQELMRATDRAFDALCAAARIDPQRYPK
jgi:dephospho-CoA kinase